MNEIKTENEEKMVDLYDYQNNIVGAIRGELSKGHDKILVYAPT